MPTTSRAWLRQPHVPGPVTGVRVQVVRQQPDGSWPRIIDRPEVPQP